MSIDTETSPVSDTEGQPADTPVAASTPAAEPISAPDSDAKDAPKSLLDVVKNVVDPKTEAPEAPSAAEPEKEGEGQPDGEEQEPSPEDDAKLPFGKHPRWQQVMKQRNDARAEVTQTRAELDRLKGPAEQYASIETFMQANDLQPTEVVELFQIGALMKGDPDEALKRIMPYVDSLLEATGRKLPEDIRQDVEEGRITEERASELSRQRAAAALAEARASTAEQRVEQVQQSTTAQKIGAAMMDWESRAKQKDPDFSAKEQFVADRSRALVQAEGAPRTPEQAVALAERAYAEVTAAMRKNLPPKPAIRQPTTSAPSGTEAAAPKSMRDAIARALTTAS